MDSVSLDGSDAAITGEPVKNSVSSVAVTIKSTLALFALFLIVVSTMFTNGVLDQFGGAVNGRNPTNYGIVLQGTFLVIFYAIMSYLIENNIV